MATATHEPVRVDPEVAERKAAPFAGPLRIAYLLSGLIAALMIAASLAGLLLDGLYRDGAWAREALRGGDLTTLVLAAPTLLWALVRSAQGSRKAQAIWIGALAYSIYNYAYYAFGAAFNDVFVLHIALLGLSIWAFAIALTSIDLGAISRTFVLGRSTRWVAGFLALVGLILGGLWVVLALRYAITGQLMADIPEDGVHLVFAIDLSLLVPALVVAGVLLWRRTSFGIVFGVAMIVLGALYQINLLVAGLFQAAADVPGVTAFPIDGVIVAAGFVVSLFVVLRGSRTRSADAPNNLGGRRER